MDVPLNKKLVFFRGASIFSMLIVQGRRVHFEAMALAARMPVAQAQ